MLSFPGTLWYITDVSNLRKQKDKASCPAWVTSGPQFPLSSLSSGWPVDLWQDHSEFLRRVCKFISEDVRRAQDRRQKSSFLFGLNTRETQRQAWWISSFPFEFFERCTGVGHFPWVLSFFWYFWIRSRMSCINLEGIQRKSQTWGYKGKNCSDAKYVTLDQGMLGKRKAMLQDRNTCYMLQSTGCDSSRGAVCVHLISSSLVWNRIKNTMRWG